jgi:hypothetical protein
VRRPRTVIAVGLALVAIVAGAIALAGGDGDYTSTSPASNGIRTGDAAPPSTPSALPPEFVQCMAEQGFDIDSLDEMHSAPPQVLQACIGSLHQ